MVKAGVYLLIRISPMLIGNYAGLLVVIIGGLTFLMTSLLAISPIGCQEGPGLLDNRQPGPDRRLCRHRLL